MKHYWSCWFTKDELKAAGAFDIHPASFCGSGLVPYQPSGYEHNWVFKADTEFATFVKLMKDKSVAEISNKQFMLLYRNECATIGRRSKTFDALNSCHLDF